MVLLILESLGSTELLFILVMALVFFGPRKLPQLSRSLGKNLAEFRKASEDFKRTWEREVALEESSDDTGSERTSLSEDNSILNSDEPREELQEPMIEPVATEEAISRQTVSSTTDLSALAAATTEATSESTQREPERKQD